MRDCHTSHVTTGWGHSYGEQSFSFFLVFSPPWNRHIMLKLKKSYNLSEIVTVSLNVMLIGCDMNGTKLAVRAAGNHQHNAFKSQNLFIFFFFRNSQTTWDFYNPTECFWSKIHSSSHFNAIWHQGIPCNWQYCETCCSKARLYCFWILLLMFFITTSFQSYALLDIINFLFILEAFETKLHFTSIHHP